MSCSEHTMDILCFKKRKKCKKEKKIDYQLIIIMLNPQILIEVLAFKVQYQSGFNVKYVHWP